MKKLILILSSLFIFYLSPAQILLNESFDSITFPPAGWINKQLSGNGSKSVWDRTTIGTDAVCTPHSGAGLARYFGYNLCAGKSAILVTPAVNLSGMGSNSALISFWMYRDNSYPTKYDSLDIYINDTSILAGAAHLGKIIRYKGLPPVETTTGWYKYSFNIPSSFNGPENYIILKATSVFGYDILIDDLLVNVTGPNDAGVSAINIPDSFANTGSNPVSVSLKNFGTVNLNSTTVGWSVNGVLCTPFIYLNSGGLATNAIDGPITIGNYNFLTGGMYTIKAWTQYPNSNIDINNANDTIIKEIWAKAYGLLPFEENFNGVWVNKKDSNDVPSIFWDNSPEHGNNSWRRDDEGFTAGWISLNSGNYLPAGNDSASHSARFHTFDVSAGSAGNLDLCLNFTPPGYKALNFWYYNESGNDSLSVLLSEDGGMTFSTVVTLSTTSGWAYNHISLGTSTTPTAVVRFRAISDFGASDIGIDSVQVIVDNSISIGVIENNSFVNIFPNPTNGLINIDIKNIADAELALYSLSGQQMFSKSISAANTVQQIDMSYLPKGTYILQIKNEKNNVIKKLVIQ